MTRRLYTCEACGRRTLTLVAVGGQRDLCVDCAIRSQEASKAQPTVPEGRSETNPPENTDRK